MRKLPVLIALAAASIAALAQAETIYGLSDTATPSLIRFDSAAPAAVTTVGVVTGIAAGEALRAIDFRPANGLLYAVSSLNASGHLYTINLTTGVATAVGGGFALAGNTSTRVSIDFNPVVDRLRVVTGSGQNYRVNPNDGALVAQDTSIVDGSGAVPLISAIAYTNSFAGATQTTLYGYDFQFDVLGTIGGINGAPSPNGGSFLTVGSSGIVTGSAGCGMDISGATGIAYFACDDFNGSNGINAELFTVNLATGLVTQISADDFSSVLDISVLTTVAAVPEPETWALMLAGLTAAGAVARRRRTAARSQA